MTKSENNIDIIWDSVWARFKIENFTDVDKIHDLWTSFHLEILKKELSALPRGSLFLEAGCGLGQWCFYANQIGHRAVGVDVAKDIIKKLNVFIQARKEYQNMKFIVDDLADSKLESNQFDYIISLGVIEHFKDSQPMLRQLHRLLKPNGKLFVSVPNLFALHTITRPLTRLLGIWDIGYEKSYTPRQLKDEAHNAGFKLERFGILQSGQLFGRVLNSLPFYGKFFRRMGSFIEKKQDIFGLYIYVICKK
jgi:SAM-dependent methyltransferase